ncbi:MAG: hypothetical protein ACKO57_03745 [Alphaproteobacteria bacterium]
MSMIVPHFSPEGQSTARHNESLLDKLLRERGQTIPTPKERLQDVLAMFGETDEGF